MVSIISTDCGSPIARKYHNTCDEQPDRAARLRHKSKSALMDAKEAVATKKAAKKQPAIEGELSLLQSNFENALEEGLKAKVYPTKGIVVIELHDVGICGKCNCWTGRKECPACGEVIQ